MRVLWMILVMLFCGFAAKAQYLTPYYSSAGSSEMTAGNVRLSVSIGQVMHAATVKGNSSKVSQGLLASGALIKGRNGKQQAEEVDVKLKVYPNPVINIVNVNIRNRSQETENHYRVELYDMFGRRVLAKTKSWNGSSAQVDFSMKNLRSGQYFIRLVDKKLGKVAARFKLIKVQPKE